MKIKLSAKREIKVISQDCKACILKLHAKVHTSLKKKDWKKLILKFIIL